MPCDFCFSVPGWQALTKAYFFDTKNLTIGGFVIIRYEYYRPCGDKQLCVYNTRWFRKTSRRGTDETEERFHRMFAYRRVHKGQLLSWEILLHAPETDDYKAWAEIIENGLCPVLDLRCVCVRVMPGDRFEYCSFAELLDQAESAAHAVKRALSTEGEFPFLYPRKKAVR
jgi:hypothetical protein